MYRNLLKKDLCTYYEYNDFLMGELLELLPYGELLDMLGKCFFFVFSFFGRGRDRPTKRYSQGSEVNLAHLWWCLNEGVVSST